MTVCTSNVTQVKYLGTALPANSDTENLWNSTLNGVPVPLMMVSRFTADIDHSHTGTIKAYWSTDSGTTWTLFFDQAVAPSTITTSVDLLIEAMRDVKVDWVNGGTTQTTFAVNMSLTDDRAPSA